jgi:RIO kinase 1
MSNEVPLPSSIEDFHRRHLITAVLQPLKSGKESTVYRCLAHPRTGRRFLALKVYRPIAERAFRNDRSYREGHFLRESRMSRAIRDRSAFGTHAALTLWVANEYANLRRLSIAGLAVPEPVAKTDDALLMEYIGDEAGPAPQLRSVRLDVIEAARCWQDLRGWITRALRLDRVHGDLSPYNVLWWRERPIVIDVPQTVDACLASEAESMLRRDIVCLTDFFARQGLTIDGQAIADDLWRRYTHAELEDVPEVEDET